MASKFQIFTLTSDRRNASGVNLSAGGAATPKCAVMHNTTTKAFLDGFQIPNFYTLSPSHQFWDTCMEQ
jgi:hypothetical protein